MTNDVLTRPKLFASIGDAVSQLVQLMSSLDDGNVNKVPYEGSWNAGQLLRHVTKSINGMAGAMLAESKTAERNPSEKVPQLQETFLSTTNKFNSPEFIVPENETYHKQTSMAELNQAFETLKENAGNANMDDLVDGLPFGPTTKLELLHFVLYHTQRHLRQMGRICEALKK